jgi:hypothetical protein
MSEKSLVDYTDEGLKSALHSQAQRVVYSYNDVYTELQRRDQNRNTEAVIKLTRWTVILTVVATIATVVSTIATLVVIFK